MTTPLAFAEQHQERFLEELFTLLRIRSVSTQPEYAGDVRQAAEWLKDHCLELGMTRVEVFETPGHPIVYGEWLGAGDAPTVLIYGHYDVQPAEKEDGWDTEPFEPVVVNGNIMGRGSTDDKGQLFIHLKVFESMMQTTGAFPVNLKVLFEGEEEAASTNLEPFIKAHQDLLKADLAVISDTGMAAQGKPIIPYGLRGMVIAELDVIGPKIDLHSGSYGGSVHNPIHALSELIATMHDDKGRVTVEGFYDNVRVVSDEERAELARIPFGEDEWQTETGAPQPWGESEFTLIERTGVRPTLEIISIKGGFLGDGIRGIVPHKASAQLTCRLVPYQDPARIVELVRQHIEAHTPPTVQVNFKVLNTSPAVLVDRDTAPMQAAIAAYEKTCGNKPIFMPEGGSIPVVTDLQYTLGLPTLLMGFGLPDDGLHAPNEKFAVEQFQLGIQTMIAFYELLPERMA